MVPADDNATMPGADPRIVETPISGGGRLFALTVWSRIRFPEVVVSKIMLLPSVDTPQLPLRHPTVRSWLSFRYKKVPPTKPVRVATALVPGSETDPAASDTSRVFAVIMPPVWIRLEAENSSTEPLAAFTGWFSTRFPELVVARLIVPPCVVTPASGFGAGPVITAADKFPVAASNVTPRVDFGRVPMVRAALSLRNRKLFVPPST